MKATYNVFFKFIIYSVDGGLGRETECVIKSLLTSYQMEIKVISRSSRINTSQAIFRYFEGH